MIEEFHVSLFCQITAGFIANVNNIPSLETKTSSQPLIPEGKFSLLLFIFIVKIKAKLALSISFAFVVLFLFRSRVFLFAVVFCDVLLCFTFCSNVFVVWLWLALPSLRIEQILYVLKNSGIHYNQCLFKKSFTWFSSSTRPCFHKDASLAELRTSVNIYQPSLIKHRDVYAVKSMHAKHCDP